MYLYNCASIEWENEHTFTREREEQQHSVSRRVKSLCRLNELATRGEGEGRERKDPSHYHVLSFLVCVCVQLLFFCFFYLFIYSFFLIFSFFKGKKLPSPFPLSPNVLFFFCFSPFFFPKNTGAVWGNTWSESRRRRDAITNTHYHTHRIKKEGENHSHSLSAV